jgi:exodeoxyribonuclease-3
MLEAGFVDTLPLPIIRPKLGYTHGGHTGAMARERNVGWRIDYVMLSPHLLPLLCGQPETHPEVHFGSDHCPVSIQLGS